MNRRTVLAAAGTAWSLSLVGCLGALENGTSVGDENGTGSGDGGPTDGGPGTNTAAGIHHLYLANLGDEPRRVTLEVVARGGDERALEGTYEIPAGRGGEFREVARWDETYAVTATLASGRSETFCWDIERCPGPEAGDDAAELPGGSRNGSVRIEPDGDRLSFVTDSCDEIVAGTAVPTGPARQFEVEGPD